MHKSRKQKIPTAVGTLMGRRLGSLLDVLEQQQILLEKTRNLLPASLSEHLVSAQLKHDILTLHTDSPAWASRLRFQAPILVKSFKQQGLAVDGVQVRIQPSTQQNRGKTAKASHLSRNAARNLFELADTMQNPALCAALKRLAQHAKD